jgi:hypothetical protein
MSGKWVEVESKSHELLADHKFSQAESFLLQRLAQFREAKKQEDLEYIVGRLAQFYSMPEMEDRPKAEGFYLELENLSKDAHSKLQTATFYFYVLQDFPKTIAKIDEIGKLRRPVDPDYYSGLSLKGQTLIETNDLQEVSDVLEEMQAMAETSRARLPYGDEMNFLERAILIPRFGPKCRRILATIIPCMRSTEYLVRARRLLAQKPASFVTRP